MSQSGIPGFILGASTATRTTQLSAELNRALSKGRAESVEQALRQAAPADFSGRAVPREGLRA